MKRKAFMPVALAAACGLLSADTMVLKDGSTIEWKSIRDLGESYEVETADGEKVTVEKSKVMALSAPPEDPKTEDKSALGEKPPPKPAAPTGAELAFKEHVTTDLLRKIDSKRDGLNGHWRFISMPALLGTSDLGLARLQIPYVAPQEYDLAMVVERREGDGEFHAGLVGGKTPFTVVVDAAGEWTGISLLEGKGPDQGPVGVKGKLLAKGAPRTVVFMVRRDALVLQVDGKDLFGWKADWSKVGVPPAAAIREKGNLWLATTGTVQISKIAVSAPK